MMTDSSATLPSRHNRNLAISLVMIVAGMALLSYAAVPLYQLFCQVTGFGGTTQRSADAEPIAVIDRQISVGFNADIDKNLPWRFEPLQKEVRFNIGESMLVAYEAENLTDEPITGMATYNVTPHEAGRYFHKVQCFCFEQQTLAPGQKVHMPISFYVDPAIDEDPNLKKVTHITLSYTFFNQSRMN